MLFNVFEIVLLSVLLFCLVIQLVFYWMVLAKPFYYSRSAGKRDTHFQAEQAPVSVIVCIKNEQHDLLQFLPAIMEQDYPEFEVIIVNDGSSDANEEALIRLKNQYPNLYSTYIPEDTKNISRKKLGLSLGIKAAKYDILLFTEPDCHVPDSDWISLMSRHFVEKKTIVLGFPAMRKAKGFFAKFRAYDFFISNLQMLSLALLKRPYAGSGRNLAYSKKHFTEQKGFVKHRILQPGEDDLFINAIANKENTAIELGARSVVISDTNNYYDWKNMKVDKAVTRRFYKPKPVALWRLESFTRVGFILSIVVCILIGLPFRELSDFLIPGIALFCLILRLFSRLFVINKTAGELHLEKFYFTAPFFDLFQIFVNIFFYIYRVCKGKDNYTYLYETRR